MIAPASKNNAVCATSRGKLRFVVKSAIFVSIQLALIAAIEKRLAALPNPYSLKKAKLEAGADTQVVLLGSSHVLNAFNPDELGCPAINLAGYSQDLYYDSQILLGNIDRLPHLECVVLGLSYFSLWYDMEECTEAWRSCYYRRYFGIPHHHLVNEVDIRNYSLFFLYGPALSRQLLATSEPPDVSALVQPNGWAANPVPADPAKATNDGADRFGHHEQMMHEENLANNLAILNHLTGELQRRGIQVILVTTPVCQSYGQHFDGKRLRQFHDAISQLQTRYGIQYFDFSSDERFELADFFNSDHLNRNGASKLSQLFGRELQLVRLERERIHLSSQQQQKSF